MTENDATDAAAAAADDDDADNDVEDLFCGIDDEVICDVSFETRFRFRHITIV